MLPYGLVWFFGACECECAAQKTGEICVNVGNLYIKVKCLLLFCANKSVHNIPTATVKKKQYQKGPRGKPIKKGSLDNGPILVAPSFRKLQPETDER